MRFLGRLPQSKGSTNDGIVTAGAPRYERRSGPTRAIGTNDVNPERVNLPKTRIDRLVSRYGRTVVGQKIAANYVRGEAADP
jgi:hypothetical protein